MRATSISKEASNERFEVLERLAAIVRVECRRVILCAELLGVLEVGRVAECLASFAIKADVVPEVIALKNSVLGDHEMVGFTCEGFDHRRRNVRMVVRRERVADVVQQCTDDVFIVASVALRTGGGLQRMLEPGHRKAAVVALQQEIGRAHI